MTSRHQEQVLFRSIATCRTCGGRGQVVEQPCSECAGLGEVEREQSLTVKIPAGAEDDMVLRVAGRGSPSREPRDVPGDLLVVVRAAPDSRFERAGADLWRVERVPVADAVLGTSLESPTIDGAVTVSVPAGTQPDAVLRLRGKGLPEFGGKRRGDLHVPIHVQVPTRLGADERRLCEELQALPRKGKRQKP